MGLDARIQLEIDAMTDSKDHAALQALVADVGAGNVIDAELLEGAQWLPMSWMRWMPIKRRRWLLIASRPCSITRWISPPARKQIPMRASGAAAFRALASLKSAVMTWVIW